LATEKQISITAVCRQPGYSKQAYYKSLRTIKVKSSGSAIAKQNVLSLRKQMPRPGTRKLYHLLKSCFKKEQISMGRDKLFDLLREEGLLLSKKKRYTKTTNSKHWLHKYADLLKQITLTHPEQVWVADITYVAIDNGFSCLHLIIDAYSKQIMGYCISNNLAAAAASKALQMTVSNRKYHTSLVHHSDRGWQSIR
jgi:putative transposase